MDRLRIALNKSERLAPLVITTNERANAQLYNTEKVAKGIEECRYFVPILTRNSYQNQWVNQEIGYAAGKSKPIYPLIENQLLHDRLLKGWIHTERDLPYRFNIFEDNERKSRRSYREDGYKPLISHLENSSQFIIFNELSDFHKEEIKNSEINLNTHRTKAYMRLKGLVYPLADEETYINLKKFIKQSGPDKFIQDIEFEYTPTGRIFKWSDITSN